MIQKEVQEILASSYTETREKREKELAAEREKKEANKAVRGIFILIVLVIGSFILIATQGNFDSSPPETVPQATIEQVQQMQSLPRPSSGKILQGRSSGESEITVTASLGSNHVVSLKTASGTLRVAFFVRSGDTVTVKVPAEKLYVYFASGDDWYGYGKGKMFGEYTAYSMDDEILDFADYTWEYTLTPVTNGNFSETPIGENDFF